MKEFLHKMNWQTAMEGMRRYLSFVILIFFFQSCTAWPAVTGVDNPANYSITVNSFNSRKSDSIF